MMKLTKSLIKLKKQKKRRQKKIHLRNKYEYTYSFKKFQTIKTFGRDIYKAKITIEKTNEYQTDLLAKIISFKKHTKPRI